jgi:DNA-directed RNA polymerase subunit RPC12/RpoP
MNIYIKDGLDYFPHPTMRNSNSNMRFLFYKHGLIGYGVYYKLLEIIFSDKGYYLCFEEDYQNIFIIDNKITMDVLKSILDTCLRKDIFDKNLYEQYYVLTSTDIQEFYVEATKKRLKRNINEQYWLLNNPTADEAQYPVKKKANTQYQSYLNTDHWKEIRERILEQRGYECENCGSKDNLQVHHLTYANIWNEKDEDLMLLCKHCHHEIHKDN